jgi:hypothetical protein
VLMPCTKKMKSKASHDRSAGMHGRHETFVAAQCDFKVLSSLLDQRDYDETMSQDTAGPSSSGYDEVM